LRGVSIVAVARCGRYPNNPFVILDKKNTWLDGTIGKVIFFSN
jgi:hypothetical protein